MLAYVDNSNSVFARKREIFEKSLLDQGLHLEYEQNRQLGFVKIHASKVSKSQFINIQRKADENEFFKINNFTRKYCYMKFQ